MRYVATVGEREHTVELEENGHVRSVELDGRELRVDWHLVGADRFHLTAPGNHAADHFTVLAGDHSYEAYVRVVQDPAADEGGGMSVEVTIAGRPYVVRVRDERSQALASLAGGSHVAGDVAIRAPMPGLVSSVIAAEGEEVKRGQTVVVLEAMKMENDLTAPRAGVVKSIRVAKGQTVNQGDTLAVVGDPAGAPEPEDDDEDE